MKVLIIGGGGREHALTWKLRQTVQRQDVFVAPGNGGTQQIAINAPVAAGDVEGLVGTVRQRGIDLIIVGDADQVSPGMVDRFQRERLPIFGASEVAKQIASNRSFVAQVMAKAGVPALSGTSNGRALGASPIGQELTAFAFTDGASVSSVVASCEYRRLEDGDRGPDTEGVGGYSPPPYWTPSLADQVRDTILEPIIGTLRKEGTPYVGILGAHVVLTGSGPRVVELRAGLGDLAAQLIIPRLQANLLELVEATLGGKLGQLELHWSADATVAVVLTAKGYPGRYEGGNTFLLADGPAGLVFHEGTVANGYYIYTSGGRVAAAVGRGETLAAARRQAYELAANVQFEGVQYRRDIAAFALQ